MSVLALRNLPTHRAVLLAAATTRGKRHGHSVTSARARFDTACVFLFGANQGLGDKASEAQEDTEVHQPGLEVWTLPKLTVVNAATAALMPAFATTAYSAGFSSS